MKWTRRQVMGSLGAAAATACTTPDPSDDDPGGDSTPSPARAPNVLIICVDQLRADALSCYGDPNIVTPAIDALAARGARFDQFYNSHPMCTPARATLLTGLYPAMLDMTDNETPLPEGLPSFANGFRDAGYRCGYVGKWHMEGTNGEHEDHCYVPPGERRRGFDHFWAGQHANHMLESAHCYFDEPVQISPDPADTYGPYWRTGLATQFLADNATEPFLLMISYAPPHPAPAGADWEAMLPEEWVAAVDPDTLVYRDNVPELTLEPDHENERQEGLGARKYLQLYYASLLSLDEMVADLVAELDALGVTGDTIVIFTSDHGEMAGSHGLYEKGVPFVEANRIPLMVVWPDHIDAGRVITGPSGQADLFATILGLADIPVPGEHHGRDLAPMLLDPAVPERDDVLVQGKVLALQAAEIPGLPNEELIYRMLRTRDHSYVEDEDGRPVFLWDLAADPFEEDNLATDPDQADTMAALSKTLADWRQRTE